MPTRHFLRSTQAEPTTGGNNYDLSPTQGSPSANVEFSVNNTAFEIVGSFRRQLSQGPTSSSFPFSFNVPVFDGSVGYRLRMRRLNSAGTALESGAYSTTRTTPGTFTGTLSFTPSAWNSGDILVLSVEMQRTGGHGTVRMDVATQNASSWVDATLPAPPPTRELSFAGGIPLQALAATLEADEPADPRLIVSYVEMEFPEVAEEGTHGVSFAGQIPLQSLAAGLEADAPAYDLSHAAEIPLQELSVTLQSLVPAHELSFSGEVPLQILAATLGADPPTYAVSFSGSIPLQELSAGVEADPPVHELSHAGEIPLQALSATLDALDPAFALAFAGEVPLQLLAATMAAEEPLEQVEASPVEGWDLGHGPIGGGPLGGVLDVAAVFTLLLEKGSLELSGRDLRFLRSLLLRLEEGSLELTGRDVAFLKNYVLELTKGSVELSGRQVALRLVDALLALGRGSLELTGRDLSFITAYFFFLDKGSVEVGGRPVALRLTDGLLSLGRGSVALSGRDLTLLVDYLWGLGRGSLEVGGRPVGLKLEALLSIGRGSLELTGRDTLWRVLMATDPFFDPYDAFLWDEERDLQTVGMDPDAFFRED